MVSNMSREEQKRHKKMWVREQCWTPKIPRHAVFPNLRKRLALVTFGLQNYIRDFLEY